MQTKTSPSSSLSSSHLPTTPYNTIPYNTMVTKAIITFQSFDLFEDIFQVHPVPGGDTSNQINRP